MNRRSKRFAISFALLAAILAVVPVHAQTTKTAAASRVEEFFIVSSVDITKHQLVLKRPTEVTQLVQVNDKTTYLEEDGKQLKLSDLRAGDTIFVNLEPSVMPALALRIRKGPMTVAELHRRYLSF
jgi:hypothetical protein